MIGFTVLGGYLGAGKTTLLNHILRGNSQNSLLENEGADAGLKRLPKRLPKRIALLINDFGDINIDAQLIESQTENQINLANGCVCCTLTDGFTNAIETLLALDPPPEHIVVEASGVADVSNLSQYGNGIDLSLVGVVVVADAETVRAKAADKYVARTIQRQLKAADLILLNKVDLLPQGEQASLVTWLSELTDHVPVLCCIKCDVPLEMILDLNGGSTAGHGDTRLHDHEQYASWNYSSPKAVSRTLLEDFKNALGPEVLRCKGLFNCSSGESLELQTVGKRKELTQSKVERIEGCQIVAIGLKDHLNVEVLQNLAERLHSNTDL